MSFALYIARRIHLSKGDESQRVSPPAIRIAIAGIAIGLVVMILSVAIVVGFKKEIREKAIGFGGHLQIHAMTSNKTYETEPICIDDSLMKAIGKVEGITSIKRYTTKPAVLKTSNDFLAVVIKGQDEVDADSFFGRNLKEGSLPETDRDILVSRDIADKMMLKVGDKVRLYFIRSDQNVNQFQFGGADLSIKTRQLNITGIYSSHFNEYDKMMIVGSLPMLQECNGWDSDMASGLEINIADFSELDDRCYDLIFAINAMHDRRGTAFHVQTITQLNPQVFSWLDLLDTNVWVILILMVTVASFTMISGLLIIILERTSMIGILKSMGCSNYQLRKVFLYVATFLIAKGLVIGNIVGIGFCMIQHYFHIIKLDPESYYLEWVPVSAGFLEILAINIGTVIIALLVLIVPSALVANISPVKAIAQQG